LQIEAYLRLLEPITSGSGNEDKIKIQTLEIYVKPPISLWSFILSIKFSILLILQDQMALL
jgi:hypothetical protein